MNGTNGREIRKRLCAFGAGVLLLCSTWTPATRADEEQAAAVKDGLAPIRSYIANGWNTLTRSLTDCSVVIDPKLAENSVLYLPADFPVPASIEQLQKQCNFQVKHLPIVIRHPGEVDTSKLNPPGLLYLDHKYVVPGGRFNEMYGWDSYFIVRGLVEDGRIDLARDMVENFFFEIEHYGNVLNANRSYYLSRSQPPFLTSMIFSVYEAQKRSGHENKDWLRRAYGYAVRDHDMWTREPHLAGDTGLSRYYDFGDDPAPESVKDETGHYRQVAAYFLARPEMAKSLLVINAPGEKAQSTVGAVYPAEVCDAAKTMAKPGCDKIGDVALSQDFYRADRSMRESGFDVSSRFGIFGSRTHHFAPVCLNSLLFKTEKDLAEMSRILGMEKESGEWKKKADERRERIVKYLWDGEHGMFFDYDLDAHKLSTYNYITTYYPLWAGLATPEQAKAIVKNISAFERPGGMVMSPYETGGQWDSPYAWAPTQLLAVEGMRRYQFDEDANRVSYKFLSTVAENFRKDGTIREKYDAVTRSSETGVTSGYNINVVGFGWTNGVFLVFLKDLPQPMVDQLAREQTQKTSAAN